MVTRASEFDRGEIVSRVEPFLRESAALGFIGPGSIHDHIDHALRLTGAVRDYVTDETRTLDLGSGGGLPGLVMAVALPENAMTLLDAQRRRCEFLRRCADILRPDGSMNVVEGRAEVLARSPLHSQNYELIVARSFGRPAAVAECAVRYLTVGGVLAVSEPPAADESRWPVAQLRLLGLGIVERREIPLPVMILTKLVETPERYPRREGVPTRQPLW